MGDHRGMPDARRQAEPQNSQALLDRRLAYLLLRLTLGINILLHGAVRLPALGAFAEGMVQEFADSRCRRWPSASLGCCCPFWRLPSACC